MNVWIFIIIIELKLKYEIEMLFKIWFIDIIIFLKLVFKKIFFINLDVWNINRKGLYEINKGIKIKIIIVNIL